MTNGMSQMVDERGGSNTNRGNFEAFFDSVYGNAAAEDADFDAAFSRMYGTSAQPAPRQRVSSHEEAMARAQQPGQGEGGFWSGVGEAISEGAKGAGRAVKEGVGGLVVNTVSGLTRLAGTPVRALTGWEGLHKLANAIDESYANFGAQALESEYGANPDGFGYGAGRFGEKLTGIAGNLGGLAAPGGIAKAAKAPAAIKTAAAAVQKSFPYMFGNNAAVQAYDTARENGKSKAEATALAGLNGAIHFLGFKAFESQSLNKMLGMPKSMEAMMPKWANEAMAESAPKTFTELARSVRNGMIKHTLAERGRGMLKAGGIMALQDMLSDVPMQVAEGGSWDNIDFNRVGKRGLEGLEEGALMEGAMGAAAMLRSNKSARNFLADKIYRNGYDVVSPSGKVYHEPGLLQTPQQRMALMKQNPDATERVLDIIEHGGVARPDELDAAFLPPDMSEKEQRKFAADWRKDLEPYVEQAWNADQSRGAGNEYFADREMSEANDAEGERRLLTAGEEKFQRQKKENDEQEAWNAKMLANEERKAKAGQDEYEQMMLEHEEARARQQPEEESRSGGEQPPPEQETPKQETPDETGNVRDEAPAQPEQGQVERPEPAAPVREEPRPMEGEPPRAEAPREGVVEPRGEETAAEPPKTPQEPPKPAEVGEATPEPEKPAEAVSEDPKAEPVPEKPAPTNRLKRRDGTDPLAERKTEVPKAEEPEPEDRQAYSGVPERLNESLSRLVTYDQETADDIAVLRKAAERNIKAGADDTPSEQDARSLRKRINQANANARESKKLGLADREKYFRDIAKDLKENLKELERNGIGEDADEVGWYRNADFNEIMDAIESGGASGSMHFEPYGIGRGAPGPFADALKGIAESGVFTGKNLERFNRLAKKINDAYKRIESDIENPRGPFGEYLNDVLSQDTSKSAPVAPAAETAPAPKATEPVEPVAKKESNRLRRADGTDPLAEKEAEAEAEKAEAKPGAMTAKQKAFRLNAMQKILGSIDPDVAIDPKALRRSQNNPNGFVLKDLKKLYDPANDGWQYELGLSKERADELRKAVHDAYEEQLAASPNRKDKTNETGQDTYSVSASRALERLARDPKSIKQMGIAHEQVLAAMTSAKERGDEQGAKFWEDRLSALNDQIGKLSPSDQNKMLKSIRDTQSRKSAMERKNTQSLESGEGKTLDVAAEDEQIGRAIDEEAVAQTNSIRGGGGKGGALSGNRHLRIDKVDGDELTVTLMDAAGKPRGTAQKMNRTQWEMLGKAAAINEGIDGDPSNPQKGDMLRMSKVEAGTHDYANDADYQKWLKSRKANDAEPLRERYEQEQAKAAKSIARNTLPGVDVEIVDRAFNPETDGGVGERKSIGGIFTGTAADYANRSRQGGVDDGPSLKSIGTGEGTQVYGWGLYGSNRRGVAESYARAGKNKSARLEFDGNEWDENAGDWGVNSIMTSYLYANDPAYSNGGDFATRLRGQAEIYKQQIDDIERNGKSDPEYIFLEKLRRAETMLSEAANDPKHTLDRIKEISPSAKVYEQTFFTDRAPGDESHLLKWYEPVSDENLAMVAKQIKKEGLKEPLDLELWQGARNPIGERFYNHIVRMTGSPKSASEFLARAGIDGVKYPVNSYGKTLKDGDKAGWNYVSFRDDNIRVDHRWEDGQMRYLRDGEGRVVGTFDRSTNKITLYRGATAATLVHELGGHATLRFAEQEAERGNRQLLDRINRTIDEAPQALKDEIRSRYPGVDETALRDEIWAALRERSSPAMEKAIKTLQGKAWYNRAWSAFRDAWKGLLARMGFNRADLSQIDRMSNDEFLSHLDRIMSDGKTLGRLEAMGEGTRANPLAESQESVREARSPRPAGSRIMDDQQTKGEKFKEKFLDRLAPAQSVQDEIGGVEEIVGEDGYTDHRRSTDFVAAADKANGREEALTRNLQKKVDQVENDISQAALKGQDTAELLADFDLYAQCKHAAERNRTIAERNGVEYDADYYYGMGKVDRGGERVGLSENVANEIVEELRKKYGDKFSHFEDAQKKLVEINREDIRNRVASGRLSAQDANQYLYRWQDYVPLKTDMAKLEPYGFNSSTASMRRNEFMKARGRGNADIADSPFAASVLQAEQGIRGSVKNELLNVAANLVEHAADKGNAIGEIVRGETLPKGAGWTFTLSDGTKVTAGGSMRLAENRPDVLLFKRNGELMAIRIDKGANGRGLALSKAISGENMGRWGSGTEWVPRMTHWMSAMRTQYSPEFTVSNLLSDHLEAYQALVGRYGIKGGSKTFAKMVASEISNFKALRNYLKTGMMTRDVGEAVRAGLLTKGGVASEGFDGKEQSIRSHIEEFRRKQKKWRDMSAADWAKNGWSNIRDFISFANEMAEYSTRMGIFSALKKQGVSVKDAVKFARDATVNFNRKGTAMPLINGLYMFANASVQGTVRSVQAMRDEHGKELVGLLVGIGVAKAVLDNVLGDDEEREKSGGRSARNLSDYDRKHNVGVPIPGTDMQFAPLRFRGPYAAVPYIAQMATNVALGNQTPEQGAVKLVKELGDQVTDIVGGNGVVNDRGEIDGSLLMQSIAPSVADPIIQLASGKDYKGDERRAKEFDKTTPASSNGKRNTPFVYKKIAQGINAIPILSGGNENRKGRLDFAPEDIQLIVEFLGAGPARDIGNAVSTAQNVAELAKGGSPERTLSQVPLVRRVVKEYPENTTRYYNAIDSYERDKAEFNRTTDLKRRAEFGRAHPQVRPMVVDGKVQSKSRVDALNDRVKELMHLERGEIKNGRKWVERKTPITEAQKKSYHDRRLELQAKVLDILGA